MRVPLATLAALALAACQVDVEGARCREPGATADCPSGQACGNDGTCSERALACATAGTRCEVGAAVCAGETGKERVERCSAEADPACGAWVLEECTAAGLECGTRGGAAACECPVYAGATFLADPADGSRDAAAVPFPTGDPASPAACRFGRLGDALAAAAALPSEAGPATVRAHGAAGAEVVFGDAASGESFPLVVAANVALEGAPDPAGPTLVRAEGATGATLVQLHGTLARIRIEGAQTALAEGDPIAPTGTALAVACGATPAPLLVEDVAVDGGGTLAGGVNVSAGACGADLSDLDVSRVTGRALSVGADTGVEVKVVRGRFRDSGSGILATGGRLTLGSAGVPEDAVEVSGNAGDGIVLTGGIGKTLDVALEGALVSGNGGTGIVLEPVNTGSSLAIRGCIVYANGATAPRTYGSSPVRIASGVLVRQVSLASFVFEGNRLSANVADQIGFETSGAWSIAAGSCGASSNLFACVADGYAAVAVVDGTGTVDASHSVWPGIPWDGYAAGGVFVSPASAYCSGGDDVPVPPATCPAP